MCSYFWWTTAICRKTFELFQESLLYQLLVHSWVRQIKKAKDNVAVGGEYGDQITLLMPNKSIDYVTVASLIKMKCANGNLKPTQAQPPYYICRYYTCIEVNRISLWLKRPTSPDARINNRHVDGEERSREKVGESRGFPQSAVCGKHFQSVMSIFRYVKY